MKRTMMIVLAVAASFTMTACDALDSILQVNIFKPFAVVSANEIAKATEPEAILELSGSDSFYVTLSDPDNAAIKQTVLTNIDTAMADPATPPATYQELAVLAASIELQTTPAGDLINNVSGVIEGMMGGTTPTIDDLFTGLLPVSVLGDDGTLGDEDKDGFIAMINALSDANKYYVALGNSIGSVGYDPAADISAGDVAQGALVTAIVASVVPPAEFATTGDYLFALISGSTSAEGTFTMPVFDAGTPLGNIMIAAGLQNLGSTTAP